MPIISDIRHPLLYYDTNTLSLLLWDGSLQAGGLVIGHVVVDTLPATAATTTLQSAGNASLASIDARDGATLITALESDSSHNPLYLGTAAKGTTTAQALWQIRKLTIDGNNNVSAIRYANGSAASDQIWDNRAALAYS